MDFCRLHLLIAQQTILIDEDFLKCAVIYVTESPLFLMQCFLRSRKLQESSVTFQLCSFLTKMPPDSFNLLKMLVSADD